MTKYGYVIKVMYVQGINLEDGVLMRMMEEDRN